MVKVQPNARLIVDLEVSSGFLNVFGSLWETARAGIVGTTVVSIYETKPTKTLEVQLNLFTDYVS